MIKMIVELFRFCFFFVGFEWVDGGIMICGRSVWRGNWGEGEGEEVIMVI